MFNKILKLDLTCRQMSAKQLQLLLEGSDMVIQLNNYLVYPLKLKIEDIQQLCDVQKKNQVCKPVIV